MQSREVHLHNRMRYLSTVFLLLFFWTAAERALAGDEAKFTVAGYSDGTSRITKESKFFVRVDPRCPAVHRDEAGQVVEVARMRGLKCVPKDEADFELVVGFLSGPPAEAHPEGYTLFGLSGIIYPLVQPGAKRGEFSAWEGYVNAVKGSIRDRNHQPPYIQPREVAECLVASIGKDIPESRTMGGFVHGGSEPATGPKVPARDLPEATVSAPPKIDDFNVIARKFLETEAIDFRNASFDLSLLSLWRGQTANALYRKLKLREREFGEAVYVSPMGGGIENVIVVAVRIVERKRSKQNLYTRYIQICFSEGNMLKRVERGMYLKQAVD